MAGIDGISLLQPGIVFRRRGRADGIDVGGCKAEISICPSAKIRVPAALATERSHRVAWGVRTVACTCWTGHRTIGDRSNDWIGCVIGYTYCLTHEHNVSSNAQSSLLACSRSSWAWRIIRIDTIRRLPLISGMTFREGAKDKRSNWKVRPCGKFC